MTVNLSEIYPPKGHVQTLKCDACGGALDLVFDDFREDVSGIDISISGLSYLRCQKCGTMYLPDHSRFTIIKLHEDAMKASKTKVAVKRKPLSQKFTGFGPISIIHPMTTTTFPAWSARGTAVF